MTSKPRKNWAVSPSLYSLLTAGLLLLLVAVPGGAEGDDDEAEKWDVRNPPGEWQSIPIDTQETTWTNLDVSPDGKTLVFDMLGDLYSLPIEGGQAVPLAHGIEWSYQPRYSPDGSKILFVSDRDGGDNLWVMNADGSEPEALTEEAEHILHNPAWSPDGQWVAARKSFMSTRSIPAGEIWLFHASGGDGLQLTERPFGEADQKNMAEPAFSNDGRYVYFSRDTTPGRVWQYNKDSTGQIFVIQRLDRDTGEIEEVAGGAGGAVRPTPSPDGKRLAFVRRLPGLVSALYLKDLASGKEWPIYDRFERDLQETSGSEGNAPAFSWTPDGESIVFWSGGKIRRIDVESREVQDIPLHVVTEKKIQEALPYPVEVSPATFSVKMPRWVQYSPDGRLVAFQALGHIYIKDLDTGSQRRLTQQNEHFEFYPSFSPDGRSLVFTTWDDKALGSIRVASLQGTARPEILVDAPGHYVEPRFSPDGRQVAYGKFTGGFLLPAVHSVDPGLYVVATSGDKAPRRVSTSGRWPQISADGSRVFFVARVEGTQLALRSVDHSGQDERTHLTGAEVTEMRLSPDERWVAFTEGFNAFVAPFSLTGKGEKLSGSSKAMPVSQISKRSGEFLHWSADSSTLHWAHGATLYSRALSDAFSFLENAPEELPEPVEEGLAVGFDVKSDQPSGRLALVGARVVTMRDGWEQQEVIEDGVVLVDGNRITAVGAAGDVTIPADATVKELQGHTIVPGFIDVHAHGATAREEITPQQNWGFYAAMAFGVTTVHDPSNDTSSIFAAAELQRAGKIVGPRIYSTGTILYGGYSPGSHVDVGSYEDAYFHVQRMQDVGAISVKSYQLPRRDQRQQIVKAGRDLGMMVVPEGGMKFQANMSEIVDGHTGIEHSLTIKTAYEDVLQLWGQTKVGYTPTFVVSFGGLSGELYFYDRDEVWKNEQLMRFTPRSIVEPRAIRRPKAPDDQYNHIFVAKTAKALLDRGVSVHIGAHGQRQGLAAHWEMWMMEQGGFTPWEALRAGTLGGAWYVGLDGDLGSIEPGKLADFAIIEGNPLADLRLSERVAYTVQNGRIYETQAMHQVYPSLAERAPFFFELDGGDTIHPATQAWAEAFANQHGCRH